MGNKNITEKKEHLIFLFKFSFHFLEEFKEQSKIIFILKKKKYFCTFFLFL
jgi:hypothetical protein